MSKRSPHRTTIVSGWLVALGQTARRVGHLVRSAIPRRRPAIPIQVVIADADRRKAVTRLLRDGLRQLEHLVAPTPLADAAILVQRSLGTDRPLAGCCLVGTRADGARHILVRLALQVNGHPLSADEVLAALAEQVIGLAFAEAGGATVLVPVELPQQQPADSVRPAIPRDPLRTVRPRGPLAETRTEGAREGVA